MSDFDTLVRALRRWIRNHDPHVRAAVIADPSASPADVERAAELEEAVLTAYARRPGAPAELAAGLYVTEVASTPPDRELQVLHFRPLGPAPEAGS